MISELLSTSVDAFDQYNKDTPASLIVLGTASLYFLYNQFYNPWISRSYRSRHSATLQQRMLDAAYHLAKHVPAVQNKIAGEFEKELQSIRDKLEVQRAKMSLQEKMPEQGVSPIEILHQLGIKPEDCTFDFKSVKSSDKARQFIVQNGDGQDSGALYAVYPKEHRELLKEVYDATALSNPMHDKWPRINAMQAEIIRWCQDLFHGSAEGYGLLTHGGTGSIIEAMASYVTHARARGIHYPEIVVPETAHAAFKKAAELTGATLITVPVDPKTGAVTAAEMSKYLSSNTAVMVGSAPSFMNGIHDPIQELGQLAQKHKIPFHVDACLGGFTTVFLDTAKEPLDFRVPGVTSISADLHKYGCCPKGTSVCLYSKDSPAISVYAALNWSGGLYATSGILDGSTSGARVAEVYATMAYYGRQKYKEIAENVVALRARLQQRVVNLVNANSNISPDEIRVFGDPKSTVLGLCSKSLNPHLIADELDKRGWKLNLLQNPKGFHLCLTHVHTLIDGFEDQFINDLKNAITAVRAYPADKKPSGNVKIYGTVGMLPTSLQREMCIQYQKARLVFVGLGNKLGFFASDKEVTTDRLSPQVNATI